MSVALEKLLSTMLSVIADNSSSGNLAMHPQLSRTAARSIIAPPAPNPMPALYTLTTVTPPPHAPTSANSEPANTPTAQARATCPRACGVCAACTRRDLGLVGCSGCGLFVSLRHWWSGTFCETGEDINDFYDRVTMKRPED